MKSTSVNIHLLALVLGTALPGSAQAGNAIKANLVITLVPEFHAGTLMTMEDGYEPADPYGRAVGEEPEERGPLLITHGMHYPFRMETEHFHMTEHGLEAQRLGVGTPVHLSIELRNGQGQVWKYPADLGTAARTSNFFTLLTQYTALRDQTRLKDTSYLWRLWNRQTRFSDNAVNAATHRLESMNCYTFLHFIAFNETMGGLWAHFAENRWTPIPENDLRIGDLVRLVTSIGTEHFMMNLGNGLYLSKLGKTDDIVITDLDNALSLYCVDRDETYFLGAYRANS